MQRFSLFKYKYTLKITSKTHRREINNKKSSTSMTLASCRSTIADHVLYVDDLTRDQSKILEINMILKHFEMILCLFTNDEHQ